MNLIIKTLYRLAMLLILLFCTRECLRQFMPAVMGSDMENLDLAETCFYYLHFLSLFISLCTHEPIRFFYFTISLGDLRDSKTETSIRFEFRAASILHIIAIVSYLYVAIHAAVVVFIRFFLLSPSQFFGLVDQIRVGLILAMVIAAFLWLNYKSFCAVQQVVHGIRDQGWAYFTLPSKTSIPFLFFLSITRPHLTPSP